ncbi:hypothetical protein LrhR19_04945 [Lacticaseibacillus rhamnosus]|nr:hypothetical protein LaR308_12425 [Lacticaseibacillus rhamnosus]KMO88613.1 hypothetical protein ACS99_13025 [Lacticaseibacillus rhamnosus]OAK77761.1 hypothetical protein LrhR19_04945 [Lacticaseibacillus rhamnosus]OHF13944.1 hypothetical protein BKP38_06645 [Lacticaseibacillus rhamnosus]
MASDVMAGLWPLRLRSLHADFCAGKRVMIEREPARVEVLPIDFFASDRVVLNFPLIAAYCADIMRRAINVLFRLNRDNTLIAASLRFINRVSSRIMAESQRKKTDTQLGTTFLRLPLNYNDSLTKC